MLYKRNNYSTNWFHFETIRFLWPTQFVRNTKINFETYLNIIHCKCRHRNIQRTSPEYIKVRLEYKVSVLCHSSSWWSKHSTDRLIVCFLLHNCIKNNVVSPEIKPNRKSKHYLTLTSGVFLYTLTVWKRRTCVTETLTRDVFIVCKNGSRIVSITTIFTTRFFPAIINRQLGIRQ